VPRVKTCSYGERTLKQAVDRMPDELRSIENLFTFKKQNLKTFLFMMRSVILRLETVLSCALRFFFSIEKAFLQKLRN
jgi:hypothetical protein